MIFPWQTTQWQQLDHAKQSNRLSHALLFVGREGLGKTIFAESLVRALLCLTNENAPLAYCNQCQSCALVNARSHPNVKWVQPENFHIKIDQIREVREFAHHSSLKGHQRFIIIEQARYMNANAANALLKTLEEPPPDVFIILITHQPGRLPATVLSRCQRILFQPPSTSDAIQWMKQSIVEEKKAAVYAYLPLILTLAEGAPLKALKLIEHDILNFRETIFGLLYDLALHARNPIVHAGKIKEEQLDIFLDLTMQWVRDLLRLQLQIDDMIHHDYQKQFMELKTQLPIKAVLKFFHYLLHVRRLLSTGSNLNKQMLLESIFINLFSGMHHVTR